MTVGLAGIVLAGGKSRRFGSDKAAAVLGGRSLLEWVVTSASQVCDPIIIVRARGQALPNFAREAEEVEDFVEAAGPVAGLIAGLRVCSSELAFATSCDAPLLRPAVIEFLASRAAGHAGAIAEVGGFRQPLVAVYRVEDARSALEASFAGGNGTLTAAVAMLDLAVVTADDLVKLDPALESFRNANQPDVLEEMAHILESRRK